MDCPPFVADCHVRIGAELLAHKWDSVILSALRQGPRLRVELLERVGGLSDKALHESLGRLVRHHLVEQVAGFGSAYAMTDLGESLASGPVRALAEWSAIHIEELA